MKDLADSSFAVSICLPCYNEEQNIRRTVINALEALREISAQGEIIIIDDGSTDKTGAFAEELAKENSLIRVLRHARNKGYGGALLSGFEQARYPWIFYTDGDGQFDIREIKKLLPLLKDSDMISGYRLHRQDPLMRKINGWGWTMLGNLFFGLQIRDVNGAFKIFPKRLLQEAPLRAHGALISMEILAKARALNYRIGQVGVHHYPRLAGKQTGAKLSVIFKAFGELMRYYREIQVLRKNKAARH